MGDTTRWLLPNGIDELLPEQAGYVESARRLLLDTCASWGYEYVVPPLVEFTDSLHVGLGADLELLSCKFPDHESGKTLAVRADITPQVARIDAHSMGRQGVNRLCYAGSTLKSIANSIPADRSPVQLGAEIFGCGGIEADTEVVDLLLTMVSRSGFSDVTFDIGHVTFCELVMQDVGLSSDQQSRLLELLARKANSELDRFLGTLSSSQAERISLLATMHGGLEVLERARVGFADIAGIDDVISDVEAVLKCCDRLEGELNVYVDMTEAHGYRYHSGLVFALYAKQLGAAVAKGGRYDGVGEVFGRVRPATGFAIDLKAWSTLVAQESVERLYVASPVDASAQLTAKESELRSSGAIVIKSIDGEIDGRCTQHLVRRNNEWLLEPLERQ